jgi:Na+-translocating ferredoxin:NAD+ oxidoreductase RnfD subunit
MLGAMIAISVGRWVFDSMIHPALTGRVMVQFLFSNALSLSSGGALATSSVLAPAHLIFGNLNNAGTVERYTGWLDSPLPDGAEAFRMRRPVQVLRQFAQSGQSAEGDLRYEPLVRDHLPPWIDTLFGVVPGGIGESSTVALVIVGLYLIYRGFLRWQLPATVLAGAFLAAAVLPVELDGNYDWFPAFAVENGRSVGLAYVFYHLTSGQLMLGAFLLAGDVKSSPMRVQGQMLFGAGIGVLTIFMRLYGNLEGECYWSIIIMNVLVGAIDRRMRRQVLGMPEE